MTITEALDRADIALDEVCKTIDAVTWVKTDNRMETLLAYVSAALEHQTAITLLVRSHLRGSALALVRSVFEILYRGTWMQFCATPEQVEEIHHGSFKFPFMGVMVSQIDAANGGTFFQDMKNNSWEDQNDFTHTGRLQRIGRVTSARDERIDYPDEGMIVQIFGVASAVIIVAALLLKSQGHSTEAERLDKLSSLFKLEIAPAIETQTSKNSGLRGL